MRQTLLALNCVLLLIVLQGQCLMAATVRPYKFGFTIEEQQHRAESRDERGIVMGEFGFITADGIYHVTVYATDENGKFRIISMKSYPYASPGPKAPLAPPPTTSTQRTIPTVPQHVFSQSACSGCFLVSEKKGSSTKTEIRPLSQPLSTPAAAVSGEQLALLGQVTGQRHTVFLPSTQITHTQTYTQASTPTQTLTQSHTTSGILGQASFHNVDAVREASVPLRVVAEIPQDLAGIEGVQPQQLNPFEVEQIAVAPVSAPPTAPTAPTTLAPVVVNAQAVALSHAIAKVEGQRPTARPTPSASAPQPQRLAPLGTIGALGAQLSQLDKISPAATGVKDLNTFVFGPPLEGVNAKLGITQAQVSQLHRKPSTATAVSNLSTHVLDLPLAVASAKPDLAKGQRIDGNVLSAIQQEIQLLEQQERIPPAPTVIKNVNDFAFGQPLTNKPQLPSVNAKPALISAQSVGGKLPQLTLPVTNVISSSDNKNRAGIALGQLSANNPQLPSVNAKPALISAQSVGGKLPQLTLPVTNVISSSDNKNRAGIALGQLSANNPQLPSVNAKPALISAQSVGGKLPQLTLPVTNVISSSDNKNRAGIALGQLSANNPQLPSVNAKPALISAQSVGGKLPQLTLPVTNVISSSDNKNRAGIALGQLSANNPQLPSVNAKPALISAQSVGGKLPQLTLPVTNVISSSDNKNRAGIALGQLSTNNPHLTSANPKPTLINAELVNAKKPQLALPVTKEIAGTAGINNRGNIGLGQLSANKQQLPLVSVKPALINAELVNAKKPQLALPVTKEIAGTAGINNRGNIGLGQLSANKQQLPLVNVKPALINAELVNAKKPQLALPVTNVVAPGSNKDRNSFAFGQLLPNKPQLPLVNVKPTAIVAQVVKATKPQLSLPVTNTIGSTVNKYPTSSAQLPTSGQHLPLKLSKPTFVKAQRLNDNVLTTMQQLVLPVNREIAGLVSQQSKNSLDGLAPRPLLPRGPSIRIPAASPNQFPTIVAASRPFIQIQTQTNTPAQIKTSALLPSAAQTLTVAHTLPISVQSAQPLLKPVSSAGAVVRPAVTATQQKQQPTGIQAQQGQQPFGSNAAGLKPGQGQQGQQSSGSNSAGFKPSLGGAQSQQRQQPSGSNVAGLKPGLGGVQSQQGSQQSGSSAAGFKPSLGGVQSQQGQQPSSGSSANYTPNTTKQQRLQPSGSNAGSYTPGLPKTATNAADLTGDLYRFKYLLDYNGHEETGSRNGDKVGSYFVLGPDAVEHMVKYIANEFGFQPQITWRKLEGNEAQLPAENALKHYEFKWFNKDSQ